MFNRNFAVGLASYLWGGALWIPIGLGLLGISTLLPLPTPVNLAGTLVVSFVLLFLFSRWTSWRQRLRRAIEGSDLGLAAPLPVHLALLAASAWLALSAVHAVWHGRLEAFKRSLKSRGLPTSLADFQEDLPDRHYAQPLFEKAIAAIKAIPLNPEEHPGLETGRWSRELFAKETGPVKLYEARIAQGLAGLAGKYSRYMKVDYALYSRDPMSTPTPKFSGLVALGNTLKLCASWRAYQGDLTQAWGHVQLQILLANLVATDRSMIAKMVALALRNQAVDSAINIQLNRPGAVIPQDVALKFDQFLSERLPAEGIKTELAAHLDLIASMENAGHDPATSGAAEGMVDRLLMGLAVRLGLSDANGLAAGSALADLATAYAGPEFKPAKNKADGRWNDLRSWPYFLARSALPESSSLYQKEWEFKSWTRLALVFSAAGKHRNAYGRYPKTIQDISPRFIPNELAQDPFRGEKFEYSLAPDSKGFNLCSAGPKGDRKDSKGKEMCIRQRL